MAQISVKELADQVGFKGGGNHKYAEPRSVTNMPIIDNTNAFSKSNVRTSIDCYVAGQYVQRNGKVLEVTQRYSVFISYNSESQYDTLQEARNRIMDDFAQRYGRTFNITNVFVPSVPVPATELPQGRGVVTDLQFYSGSKVYLEQMGKYEKMRYEISTQRDMARTNISSIRGRYGYKR